MFQHADFKENTYYYELTLDFEKTNVVNIRKALILETVKSIDNTDIVKVQYINIYGQLAHFNFGIEKSKLLKTDGRTLYVPDFIYNHVHGFPNPPLNKEQTLTTLLMTGNPQLDNWIRQAKIKKDYAISKFFTPPIDD